MKKIFFLFKFFLIILTIILLYLTILITSVIINNKDFDINKIYTSSSTKIYDNNANLILELGDKKQLWVNYDDISINMINAITSVEDKRFFNHSGIDYKRLISALIKNIIFKSYKEGASTITQQLIKNTMLTNEKTLKRKIKEIYFSMILESKLSKNQIIEAYLNNILYGNKIYGIERASLYYFNKNAKDLTVTEAALLAGIIQLPNYYNPYKNINDAKKRRNTVLNLMYENSFINLNELNNYLKEDIILDNSYNLIFDNEPYYNSYIDYVIYEAINDYNLNPYNGNLNIYTNIDLNMQKRIYDILSNNLNYFPDELLKSGIILIDNKTGHIEGIGGSRSNNIGDINYGYEVLLQPASTIKPILDYAPAMEYFNLSPASIIDDSITYYSTGMKINNWDKLYKGKITLRKALKESRNVPAYKLYMKVGMENAHKFMNRFNLYDENIYESQAIGGFSNGFSVLDMTNAYQAIANKGIYIKSRAISYIELNGEIIKINDIINNAMKKTTAFLISDMLADVISYSNLSIKNMRLSGKSGQTNYDQDTLKKYNIPSNATKDSWFIGYNNYKTIGVWVGYDYISSKTYLTKEKKDISKTIFKDLMIYYNLYDNTYQIPNGIVKKQIEIIDDKIYLSDDSNYIEYFYKYNVPSTYYKKNE